VAFASNRDGRWHIWVANADGTKARRLTSTNKGADTSPRWAPNGKTIVFTSDRTGDWGQYWWVAKGNNHETLCASELYTTKQAKDTIKVVKQGAANTSVYDETGEVKGDIAAKRIAV